VSCVWQVVKTPTIILNNPVFSKISEYEFSWKSAKGSRFSFMRTDREIDSRTDRNDEAIVAFCNFANLPNKFSLMTIFLNSWRYWFCWDNACLKFRHGHCGFWCFPSSSPVPVSKDRDKAWLVPGPTFHTVSSSSVTNRSASRWYTNWVSDSVENFNPYPANVENRLRS